MSFKRKLRRKSLLSEIDSANNIVIFRNKSGGNAKLTKSRKKNRAPKHVIVSVQQLN